MPVVVPNVCLCDPSLVHRPVGRFVEGYLGGLATDCLCDLSAVHRPVVGL